MLELKDKLKEAISSILPIATIMTISSLILGFSLTTTLSIIVSTLLLIIGVTLFTYGAELSMIEIGKVIASTLVKTKKTILIIAVAFVVGIIITVAEPDLKVLATQMTAIPSTTLILCVGLGVGLFLALAAIRILFQVDLKKIIAFFYLILLAMIFISTKEMVPISFDSGGVTTGPMSVPFIIAMGIGFSKARPRKEAKENSFGLVALCSIGPILTVLILGLLMPSNLSYTYDITPEVTSSVLLIKNYLHEILPIIKDVTVSLLPIIGVFIIFNFITKKVTKKKFKTIISGLVITLIGLALFFLGVNVGYMPNAYLLGMKLHDTLGLLTIIFGVILGFVIVRAEPAVSVLTEQIEEMTEGSLKKSLLTNTIACGVSVAVALSITRVMTGLSITWILVVGYSVALFLMIFTPKIFTMVAFDSGGAVSGPMTTSFLLPFIIGICYAHGGNVLTDAFGLVAFVALSPLITIQILGIIYKVISSKKAKTEQLDETIIDFDWRVSYE
jgi:hypothetical protein